MAKRAGGILPTTKNASEREEQTAQSRLVICFRRVAGSGWLKCHGVIFKESGISAYFRQLCGYLGREIRRHTAAGPFPSIPLVLPFLLSPPPPSCPPVLLSKCHSAGLLVAALRRSFSSHLETLIAVLTALAQYAAHNYRQAHTRCSSHTVQSNPPASHPSRPAFLLPILLSPPPKLTVTVASLHVYSCGQKFRRRACSFAKSHGNLKLFILR